MKLAIFSVVGMRSLGRIDLKDDFVVSYDLSVEWPECPE
jgi:hypothetical protein